MNPSDKDPVLTRSDESDAPNFGQIWRSSPPGIQKHGGYDEAVDQDISRSHRGSVLKLPKPMSETPSRNDSKAAWSDMPPKADFKASTWTKDISVKYGKIARLQDRFLTDQSQLNLERATVVERLRDLDDSMTRCVQLLEATDATTEGTSPRMVLKTAQEQFQADRQGFEQQMHLVMKLEHSLGNIEYKLGGSIPELLDHIGSSISNDRVGRKQEPQDIPERSHRSSSPLEPLADKYYDKRGDVRLLRDQLFNHLATLEHPAEDQLANTSYPTEAEPTHQVAGNPASQPQQLTLQQLWQMEHRAMEQNLHDEEQELKRLWDACQDAGIDVGQLSRHITADTGVRAESPPLNPQEEIIPLNEPHFLWANPSGVVSRFLKDLPWPERGSFIPAALSSIENFAEKRDSIEQWMFKLPDTIFGTPQEPSQWTEFGHVLANSKSEGDWVLVDEALPGVPFRGEHSFVKPENLTGADVEDLERKHLRRTPRKWRSDGDLKSHR